jgi:NADH:ubiquinone oxidoreductase subunit F (NADH-binding)
VSAATRAQQATPIGLPRLLTGIRASGPVSLDEHHALHGPLPAGLWRRAPALIQRVEQSGLRGRGGGRFPTGDKLRAVAAQRGRPVVVVNALEGEPVSGKDKALLRHAPHLVLDGATAAAAALGARTAIVAVSADAGPEQRSLAQALAARERAATDHDVALSVALVPSGFVSGEETAILRFLNGGPPKPTVRPPLPHERGVGGAPTLVHNAETLAQLALIARLGPDWFRALGTPAEPGSMLVTVSGAVHSPGVLEIAIGTPLAAVIQRAGGFTERPRALLLGGYFGTWVPAAAAAALRLSETDLGSVGARLGAGAIVALPDSACAVTETARVARYLAEESAGQCGPCAHGLDAAAEALERLAQRRPAPEAHGAELARILRQVNGRGACRHPDVAVRFIGSALEVFADEIAQHLAGGCRRPAAGILPVTGRRRT